VTLLSERPGVQKPGSATIVGRWPRAAKRLEALGGGDPREVRGRRRR
jgi:hypothetical protein